MQDGLVSVIMPSYNTGKYIAASIRSVIAQTYDRWELIIVDDASTDDTDSVVAPFLTDGRIRYIKNPVNMGAALSRNTALRAATGKWIAFLDSDDIWAPEKLSRQTAFMLEKGYDFTYTDYMICLNGEWVPYIYVGPDVVDRRKMYDYCYFSTITVMYDREKIGLVQISDLRKNNDYAMWLHIIEKSSCHRLPECLSYYIKHDGSVSSGSKLKLIKWHYLLFRIELKKNPFAAACLTVRNLFFGFVKKIRYREKTSELPVISQSY